jgi:hypothetical protein
VRQAAAQTGRAISQRRVAMSLDNDVQAGEQTTAWEPDAEEQWRSYPGSSGSEIGQVYAFGMYFLLKSAESRRPRNPLLDCCKPFPGKTEGPGVGCRKVSDASVRCVHRLNCKITTRVVDGQVPPRTPLGLHGRRLRQRARRGWSGLVRACQGLPGLRANSRECDR